MIAELSPFLSRCLAFVKDQSLRIIRVSEVYQGGEINTAECLSVSPCQNVYSIAKTFTMTAIGILYDKGLLRLNEKICDILSNETPKNGMDPRWQNATVEMALTHRLGLPEGFLDIDVQPSSSFTDNFLKYLFTYPLSYEPNTEARYSDGAYYLLARIVESKTGISLENYLWKEILTRLDFQELAWSHCPRGHAIGATGLYVHSADLVKLGMVYLNDGVYRNDRILSEEWVKTAIAREYALNRYGKHGAYGKGGMFGQELIVVPNQQRVIAIQAFCNDLSKINDFIFDYGNQP